MVSTRGPHAIRDAGDILLRDQTPRKFSQSGRIAPRSRVARGDQAPLFVNSLRRHLAWIDSAVAATRSRIHSLAVDRAAARVAGRCGRGSPPTPAPTASARIAR